MSANYRIELALLCQIGEVSTKSTKRRSFDVFFRTTFSCRSQFRIALWWSEIGVQLLEDFITGPFDINFQTLENPRGHAFTFTEQAKQDMLGSHVRVV